MNLIPWRRLRTPDDEQLAKRVRKLEADVAAIRAELDRRRQPTHRVDRVERSGAGRL